MYPVLHRNLFKFAAAAALAHVGAVFALPVSFSGSSTNSSNNPISALVQFDTSVVGGVNYLTLTLTNTYNGLLSPVGGADVMTGLYFNDGGVTLTPVSAVMGSGSTMIPSGNPSNVPAAWAYFKTPGLVNGAAAGSMAIAATGLISGTNYDFNDTYHGSSGYLAGPAYGLIGNQADTVNGRGLIPEIANTLVFTFSYSSGAVINNFTNVEFIYGTSTGEGSCTGTPVTIPGTVPDTASTVLLLSAAVGALLLFRRRSASASV